MNILQGFKTITFNIVAIAASWLASEHGIEVPKDHQTAITITIVSLVNIVLRFLTNTPIGRRKNKHQK
ncbi:hypothetical protein [Candidatus Tisiphia endosymbiont of Ptychoptera albimana]|uniref:hypothetical protein n=1 Tax=Candidatus Tisiphia endosymbiont of Ptychoptera albimana TaxID=3066260 RepID=UPI00312C7367